MGKEFNFDSTDEAARGPIMMLASLIVIQGIKENADEIIFTLKSRAEWMSDSAKDASQPDAAKVEKVESIPPVEPQPMTPTPKTQGATMEDVIEAAKKAEEWEAKAGMSPIVERPQMARLEYVIPDRGRVDCPPPPASLGAALIRLLLLHANIPFRRALFLRAGIPYWNHGPLAGTFQTSGNSPTLNTSWKLESADTTRGLRLIRLRE